MSLTLKIGMSRDEPQKVVKTTTAAKWTEEAVPQEECSNVNNFVAENAKVTAFIYCFSRYGPFVSDLLLLRAAALECDQKCSS